ncbi:MAG: hypothetical protein ABIS13_06340 [Nitrosospira sp.]
MNTRVDRYWQRDINTRNLLPRIAAWMVGLISRDVTRQVWYVL